MDRQAAVLTDKAPKPIPQFSQAVKYNGMVYCSGSIGMEPKTWKLVEGSVKDRTVYMNLLARGRNTGLTLASAKHSATCRPSSRQPEAASRTSSR
jgi:enamine deaminase RidA (YjgF/YER057c/UK114 family)